MSAHSAGDADLLKAIGVDGASADEFTTAVHSKDVAAIDTWSGGATTDARRALDGFVLFTGAQSTLAADPLDPVASATRDIWMAGEIIRLAAEIPDAKIIVWSASFHAAAGSSWLDGETYEGVPYRALHRMGDVVKAVLGDKVRSIALTAGGGEFGHAGWPAAMPIAPPKPGSFEAALLNAGADGGLVRPWEGVSTARPFGYSDVTGCWADAVDAFLYVPLMRRATPSPDPRTRRQRTQPE